MYSRLWTMMSRQQNANAKNGTEIICIVGCAFPTAALSELPANQAGHFAAAGRRSHTKG